MARPGSRTTALALEAVVVEGGLIAPEQIAKVAGAEMGAKAAAEYGCPKGTTLRDEIARYYSIGRALWAEYDRIEAPTVIQTATFARDLLSQCFGFTDLTGPHEHREGSRRFRIAWEAKNGRVPVMVAAPVPGGDAFAKSQPEFGDGEGGRARRSPTVLLQDWLNANPGFYWGLVFAGDRVRLMRDNASLTRPAWIEADLGAMFRDEMFADFTAWWLLTHATRFGAEGAAASDCALERWREEGLKQGTSARERLREGVEEALRQLGQGLVEANPEVRGRIADNRLPMTALFEELLRTVYRLIFLAVAEDRDLLHPRSVPQRARTLYAENYSFTFWRERSRRRVARDHHHDAWEGMKITLAALEHGQPALGLPALGGLFARGATPTLNDARIPNRCFLETVFNLGFIRVEGSLHRINWRDMKTEELGSVYESLLEIRPSLAPNGDFVLDSGAKGNARKTSGSYYTPDSLVETLLDSALDPVLEKAEANAETPEDQAAAILDLRVIDPACGSGHFLLGAARRMADRVALWRNPDAGKEEKQAALRDVVSRCIHGVDRNPMAVELAKVALWIESVSPGQPLGFLDANIRCGDALLGVFDLDALEQGIPDEAYKPLTGDDKAAAKYYLQQNRAAKKGQGTLDFHGGGGAMPPKKLAANLATIKRLPEDTVGQVEEKKRRFDAWRNDPARWTTKVACDLYIAAFLLPKTEVPEARGRDMVPTTADVRRKLSGGSNYGPMEAAAVDAAEAARPLHWPLAFPDVMVERGGFDVVLGNPPWERVVLQEQEFFSGRAPEIAMAPNKGARERLITQLGLSTEGSADRCLFAEFQSAKRKPDAETIFAKISGSEGGRYPLTGRGGVNTYALFLETARASVRNGGKVGFVVPSGIMTDAHLAGFFSEILHRKEIESAFTFGQAWNFFSETTTEMFTLLTLGFADRGAIVGFHLREASDVRNRDKTYILSADSVRLLNPNTNTAPVFRTNADASLVEAIYRRVPVLIEEDQSAQGNSWSIRFLRMFDMATDSGKFLEPSEVRHDTSRPITAWTTDGQTRCLPLYEGKMMAMFEHRHGTFEGLSQRPGKGGTIPKPSTDKKANPNFEVLPWYWVRAPLVEQVLSEMEWPSEWIPVWRFGSKPTNERTLISSILPRVALPHVLPAYLPGELISSQATACLLSNLGSLVVDLVCRMKMSRQGLDIFIVKQLPILPPTAYTEADLAFIVPRVLELTYTSHSMAPFARDLGHEGPPFAWDEDRRAQLRAELDAWYALAYGLSRDELRYVLDPKDVMGEDYPSETFRVLKTNEERKYGEYRTRRLVLAAYDALVEAAPDTAAAEDGAWTYHIRDEADVRLLLAAIIKRMRQPRPIGDVMLAFLYAAQPHLLTPHLSADRQAEWRRLVGNAATPATNVASFASAHLSKFMAAKGHLAANGAWRFDQAAGTVDRGSAIYASPLPPSTEGRADFVWHAMRSIAVNSATSALPQEERTFLAHAAAA
jgi:hypothetical protein